MPPRRADLARTCRPLFTPANIAKDQQPGQQTACDRKTVNDRDPPASTAKCNARTGVDQTAGASGEITMSMADIGQLEPSACPIHAINSAPRRALGKRLKISTAILQNVCCIGLWQGISFSLATHPAPATRPARRRAHRFFITPRDHICESVRVFVSVSMDKVVVRRWCG